MNENQLVKVPNAGEMASTGFEGVIVERAGETSARAMAKQAEAAIQARYVMAMQRPRDIMAARERLLKDCARPFFAEKAIYRKPIGQGIEGPSIRLAEAAARAMTNIMTAASAVYDDADKRIVRVMSIDLENNSSFEKDVTIPKTVERSSGNGREVVSVRTNKSGKTTYLVKATDDEILNTENALISKAMRGTMLRLIPGDILEEAIHECYSTMDRKDAEDPDAAVKKMADAFASIGVNPDQLSQYLGHPLAQVQAKELKELRGIYTAIKDGEASWAEAVQAKDSKSKPDAKADASAKQTLTDVAKKETEKQSKREPGAEG